MTINSSKKGGRLTISVSGRVDTNTAPEFEKKVKELLPDIREIVFDLKDMEYVSSAGLRVFLSLHKIMNGQGGSMVLTNVGETVMEVFEITGFTDILTIK